MNDHPTFITVTQGMSGYFAVMVGWSWEEVEEEGFYEPVTTGFGRYKEKEDAVREAKEWADAEELEYCQ